MSTTHIDEGMPQSEFENVMAQHGIELIAADPADLAAAADGEDDPDAVLGTDADPDFVEHGNHGDDWLQQLAAGEVDDDCPYCPTAAELNDHGDTEQNDGADDAGTGDGD